MRSFAFLFASGFVLAYSHVARAEISLPIANYDCVTYAIAARGYSQGYTERELKVRYRLDLAQAPYFHDNNVVRSFLNRAAAAAVDHCARAPNFGGNHMPPPIRPTGVSITVGDFMVGEFQAKISLRTNEFAVLKNDIMKFHFDRERKQADERQRLEAAQMAAQQKEKRKQDALTDCGSKPKLSGGPWFSSTYSVAAIDASRTERFLCVKTIEYISAAPNPFGGKAARARFVGYDRFEFKPREIVADFAY